MFPEITRDDVFRLETERLWLRWPRAADSAYVAHLAGDPDVALQTARIPLPYEMHHAEAFIIESRAENAAGAGLVLALTQKRKPNEPIGVIGLHGAGNRGVATLGFWLGKPFWGQGLMTEAASVAIDLVFGVTSLERIASFTMTTNDPALRLHRRLGFSTLGRDVRPAPARGAEVECELFEIRRGATIGAFGMRRPKFSSGGQL
jgi:RimJ/RimL family protein N-acetyltransferase